MFHLEREEQQDNHVVMLSSVEQLTYFDNRCLMQDEIIFRISVAK